MNEWIESFLEDYGSVGVGILMLVENVFPPLPSEVIMPWAGYAVSQGDLSLTMAILAGSVGSFAGAMFWYWVAIAVGRERLSRWIQHHGHWLTIHHDDLRRTEQWFGRWGDVAVLVCRMIPGLRTLISVPAGFVGMPHGRFTLFTAVGTVAWTSLLTGIGWWLGDNYAVLAGPLSWVSLIVMMILAAIWLYRLARQHRQRASGNR